MALEKAFAFGNALLRQFAMPVANNPADDRPVSEVFQNPYLTFADPDKVRFKDHTLPTIPHAPVTTGLDQVVYDDQPEYNRFTSANPGPVREFFRNWKQAMSGIRQP